MSLPPPVAPLSGTGSAWLTLHPLTLDRRALALFRIGLALVVLGDLAVRAGSLAVHYSDEGVLPRADLLRGHLEGHLVSLHLAGGSVGFVAALFLAAAAAALAMLVGWRTRTATAAVWLLTISLQSRNPLVAQGGDDLLRLLLFWALWLPLDDRWSLAARRAPRSERAGLVSTGGVALLAQLWLVYACAAFLKWGDDWWGRATAVEDALRLVPFATGWAAELLRLPSLLPHLTRATVLWEAIGPSLLLVPNARVRTAIVGGFILMHLSFRLFLCIGIFPFVCVVAWSAFLPGAFFDALEQRLPPLRRRVVEAAVEPPPSRTRPPAWRRWLAPALALASLALVVATNLRELGLVRRLPAAVDAAVLTLRLDQRWGMFAPHPPTQSGWIVIPGRLRDGRELDLFRDGRAVELGRPPLHSAEYRDDRWRKYFENLGTERWSELRLPFGSHVCRAWNEQHHGAEQLLTFELLYVEVSSRDAPASVPRVITLWQHHCF